MSDEWHRHLGNLTFWEQIDRFFNPNKYSCINNFVGADDAYHVVLIIMFSLLVCSALLFVVSWWVGRKSVGFDSSA